MKKNRTFGILLLLINLSFINQVEAKLKKSSTAVGVDVELEEMPSVRAYEIEVKSSSILKNESKIFSQKESIFKIKLNVGNYQMRTRILSIDSEVGPWSGWTELLARPETVDQLITSSYNLSIPKNDNSMDIELNWERANGADKYVVWVEDLNKKNSAFSEVVNPKIKLKLTSGEYKIGVQSISKDGIRSDIKYFDNTFFVAKTKLPQIKLDRVNATSFRWAKQKEAEVKIDIYRKAFFGEKFIKVYATKQSGELWQFPLGLKPGEYKIDFQYISETFENGPLQRISYLKKPNENDFAQAVMHE